MSDEDENVVESEPIEMIAAASMQATGTIISASSVVGDQTLRFEEANVQISLETAAHQRDLEKQRLQRELEKDEREENERYKDRHHQRIRDNCTYGVVICLVVAGLVGSFGVAVNSTDPTQQVWAQGLTTTIAGVVGGAFAGYMLSTKK